MTWPTVVGSPVCASVPHHITAAFSPSWHEDPLRAGSVGVGLAVEPRLTLCRGVDLGGALTETARKVLNVGGIDPSSVSASRSLPWGMGYASSGASAAAAAVLVSAVRGIDLVRSLQVAHSIEVADRTGLGDVLAISCGVGVVLRRREGAPGIGEVVCAPVPGSVVVITLEGGRMTTPELLSALGQRYYSMSEDFVRYLDRDLSFERFAQSVTEFTESLGLLTWLVGDQGRESVRRTPGLIGYYVKKRLLVMLVERGLAREALLHASEQLKLGGRLLEPSLRGPELR